MRQMRVSLALVACCGLVAGAGAATFWTETFETYTTGNLVPQGGWWAHSGAGSAPVQVVLDNGPVFPGEKAARLSHASGTREDVNRSLGTVMGAGQKFYAGFDVKVSGPLGTGADYFAHFRDPNAGTRFVCKTGVQPDGAGFNFTLTAGSGSTVTAVFPGTFTLGNWYRVVFAYTYDTNLNEVWIDPVTEASTKITGTWGGGTTGNCTVENFALRQGSIGTATHTVDNIIVGTTFAEVVPEPSSLLLVALGLALIRRR